MGGLLESLYRLQEIETRLAAIRKQAESKARRIEIHKRRVQEAAARLEANRRNVRERRAKQDALTLEVASREDAIAKQREALTKAKTNKAYAEILAVMNTGKADNSKLESTILQLMEEIQHLEQQATQIEAERGEALSASGTAERQLHDYEEEHRDELVQLEAARDEYAQHIPPTALAVFSRVAGHHDGEAMAAVIKMHPKREDYACSGCNMKITLEVLNGLQKNDELQICNCCGRVLFLESAMAH